MDPSRILYIIILFLLILTSAFCSASETALSSASMIKIKHKAKNGNKKAKRCYKLMKNYSQSLTTILIFNNIANTASASIATFLISSQFGAEGVVYATVIMTILILIFGEILPKVIAKQYAESLLLKIVPILKFLVTITRPISYLIIKLEKLFEPKRKRITATEKELLEFVQTIEQEGVLEQEESELIQNAAQFDDKKISDIMVPVSDVVYIYDNAKDEDLKQLIIEKKFSRIPVLSHTTNKVIGILHESDLIDNYLSNKSIKVNDLMKSAIYLSKNRRLSYALRKIQKSRNHIAIVEDNNEDHKFLGIVTLEDILEELVGEIYDEYDDLPKNVLEIGLHTFQIDPNINVKDFFEKYIEDVKAPNIKSKTFVGWLNELSKNKIKLNREYNYENISMKVLEMVNKVPTKVEIEVNTYFEEI